MPAPRPAPPLSTVTLPDAWRDGPAGPAAVDPQWWRAFGDPALTALVEAALAHNTSVLAAVARVDQARALVTVADSAALPAVNAVLGAASARAPAGAALVNSRSLQPELQASWELDLFGRLRQQSRAASLQYQASQAERDGVALSVAASTAQAYVGLLALDAQLRITKGTAASRAEALRLASDQARVGYTSQLQLSQAQNENETVLQAIPELELAIRRQENALRVLTGELPGAVPRERRFQDLPLLPAPASIPSSLLARRPDIAQGQLLLAASDANLALRRADFLPHVTISAKFGSLLTNGRDYDPVTLWTLGASVLAPVFSAGRLSAQVDAATAQRDQAAFAYRGVVLTAFGEVENAFAGVTRLQTQMEHAQKRRDILTRTLDFARDRYQAGYASYLEVLDAQRNLYQVELNAVTLRQNQVNNMVALYRALGGGWSAGAP
ncbi:efflux transporter outer membrane subunit [Massilia sp. CCM 8733]|uniref:Efflux transporter outer membrane subunit n=2 Tax=Massilia mucilaginosa TaxID=2609282 RepID=A0ABX0NYV0_9BURK|nr:efflux transporter outer membrane subunit [Massilia mucilaginosa]NHZ91906.1 efflux transporter outer membrane subunit [Massilia mucilaginosa]